MSDKKHHIPPSPTEARLAKKAKSAPPPSSSSSSSSSSSLLTSNAPNPAQTTIASLQGPDTFDFSNAEKEGLFPDMTFKCSGGEILYFIRAFAKTSSFLSTSLEGTKVSDDTKKDAIPIESRKDICNTWLNWLIRLTPEAQTKWFVGECVKRKLNNHRIPIEKSGYIGWLLDTGSLAFRYAEYKLLNYILSEIFEHVKNSGVYPPDYLIEWYEIISPAEEFVVNLLNSRRRDSIESGMPLKFAQICMKIFISNNVNNKIKQFWILDAISALESMPEINDVKTFQLIAVNIINHPLWSQDNLRAIIDNIHRLPDYINSSSLYRELLKQVLILCLPAHTAIMSKHHRSIKDIVTRGAVKPISNNPFSSGHTYNDFN